MKFHQLLYPPFPTHIESPFVPDSLGIFRVAGLSELPFLFYPVLELWKGTGH